MKKIITRTLTVLTIAMWSIGAQAGIATATPYDTNPTYHYELMVVQLLPKLMGPISSEDKSEPYDPAKDCLLVPQYQEGPGAPVCQIVLLSSDFVPVNRTHTRFFIKSVDGNLGPYATGNMMGAPVAQPYPRAVDHHEVNQTNEDKNM
jgi:hypothetical protein